MQIDALHGHTGMMALLHAFRDAAQTFELDVLVAVPSDGPRDYHLLLTIGSTTAALTIAETQWMADMLINQSGGVGKASDDLERFGRMIAAILAESPSVHGLH